MRLAERSLLMSLEQQPQELHLLRVPQSGAPWCHTCYQYARQGQGQGRHWKILRLG